MKNFFLTILLVLTTTFGLSAQTLNLNAFNHSVTPGQCRADGKIKVTLPPTMGPANTKLQVKLDKPNGASLTEPLEIGVKNSYEFDTLGAGVYTITVIEVATNKSYH